MTGKLIQNALILIIIFCAGISGCIKPTADKGDLQITSSPSGAEIYLDGQYQGTTPSTIRGIVVGDHTVEFRYSGYQNKNLGITVNLGTTYVDASLAPAIHLSVQPSQNIFSPTQLSIPSQSRVTVQISKDTIIIGDSISFSGTCSVGKNVILMLYGPGYYTKGLLLDQPRTDSAGSWNYTWNPGYSVQQGSYTMIVYDSQKVVSDRIGFTVIGGGEVTISTKSNFVSSGDSVTFSGRCTTGSKNVLLTLYGPERYSNGVDIAMPSVTADKTWSYTFRIDSAMPAGQYSMSVHDTEKTKSGFVQFNVGLAS